MKGKKISIAFRPFVYDAIYTLAQKQQMSFSRFVDTEMAKIIEHSGITQAEKEHDDYTYTKEELIATFDKAKENCVTFNTAEEAVEFIKSGKPYGSMGFNDQNEWQRFDKLIREQCAND